ncbi:MAG TPA: N-methyl-L-tryptophan oxidase [Roseomonas sp.]|jgi:sarcosine oxidase
MQAVRTEVAVVGLGAMGAATLYQLARRGIAALGIDRYAPPHDRGSSHGETRITRCAVGEGDSYVPFVQRSHAIWRTLEAETGEVLLDACGLLMMAPRGVRTGHHGKTDFLRRTIGVAARHGIAHEQLDSAAVAARYPAFQLAGDEEACFEPGGGFLHPERCVAAQLRRAAACGAAIRTGCRVLGLEDAAGAVRLETEAGPVLADQVVVAAGAWAGKLLGLPFGEVLVPFRQQLHWFPVADPAAFRPGAFPAYIWMHGARPEDYFYGFPALPGSGAVKVATEHYAGACDPDTADRAISARESAWMYDTHVAGRLRGAAPGPARGAACLYTVTPDGGFIIDRHPGNDRIILVSPCSGHGFKHSAGIGEAVAELAIDGRSTIDLGPFRLGRFTA